MPSPAASSLLSLSCSDSADQQGQGGERVIGVVLVTGPGCVTFEVSSAAARAATVTVPIGTAIC